MINYIIQVLLFQTLFLAIYDLALRKETFFQWNRAYLIITSVLAYIIPLIRIERLQVMASNNLMELPPIFLDPQMIFLNEVVIGAEKTVYNPFKIIYIIGFAIALLLFTIKLIQIIRKIKNSDVKQQLNFKLVILKNKQKAFSFFNYLFLGKKILETDHQHIIEHELVHIKQKHSLDLIFFEIQKIVFWFNPFSYIFQRKISTLHEFIADANTIAQDDKIIFFENLLTQTFQVEKRTFVNNFYKKSLLKKRIIMATKSKSKQIFKLKYLLLIPVLASMLVYTSCSMKNTATINQQDNTPITDELIKIVTQADVTKKIDTIIPSKATNTYVKKGTEIFNSMLTYNGEKVFRPNKIDESPYFENSKRESGKVQILIDFMQHAKENINKEIVEKANLDGSEIISVYFVINKQGKIVNINSSSIKNEALKTEVLRVLSKVPKIIPGKHQGEFVNTVGSMTIMPNFKKNNYPKSEIVPFSVIDEVPVYSGCENSDRPKRCMQKAITTHVNTNFNTNVSNNLGLTAGKKRISVQFLIDKNGEITDIKARAPHPVLQEEAIRVMKLIPKMKAGKQDGKAVNVRYNLPIVFMIEDDNTQKFNSSPPPPPSPKKIKNTLTESIPFSIIDEVPVYSGCENSDRPKRCMQKAITTHVNTNFNTNVSNNLGLSTGKKRISVQFLIDKNGEVVDIKARAPHPTLQEEAIRVMKLIPKMKAGKQDGKTVSVRYQLPIIFSIK